MTKISRKAPKKTTIEKSRALHNSVKTDNQFKKLVSKKLKHIRKVENKLKEIGVSFQCVIVNNPRGQKGETTRDTILIDSSDDDIQFKTPPTAKKLRKVKTTAKKVSDGKRRKSARLSVMSLA